MQIEDQARLRWMRILELNADRLTDEQMGRITRSMFNMEQIILALSPDVLKSISDVVAGMQYVLGVDYARQASEELARLSCAQETGV